MKRLIYEVKLFYVRHWGTPLTDPIFYIGMQINLNVSLNIM